MDQFKLRWRLRLLAASMLLLLLAGCGYRFIGASSEAPQHFTVAVPIFRNLTYRPGIEGPFTEAVVQSLMRHGVRVGDAASADYLVTADIITLGRASDAYSASDTAVLYKNEVEVDLTIRSREVNEVLVRERVRRRADAPAEVMLAMQAGVDRAAREELASQVAQAVLSRLLTLPPRELRP